MMSPTEMLPREDTGSFEEAVGIGLYLLMVKAALPSSESFTGWLKKNCQLSQRAAYNKIECTKIKRKNPEKTFPTERAALDSVGSETQAVARPAKQQRLVQVIAERLVKMGKSAKQKSATSLRSHQNHRGNK